MDVAIAVRVSKLDNDETGTVQAQLEYLQEHCRQKRWTVVETYVDDGVSGTVPFAERPEGARILRDAARHRWEAIVFKKLDRVGRSVKVIYDFIAVLDGHGRGFVSAAEDINTTGAWGRAQFGLMAVFAQLERDIITERMLDGRKDTAKQGGHYGGPPPYGYRSIPGDRFPILQIERGEADIIDRIFAECLAGRSVLAIAEALNHDGIPSPSLSGWGTTTVHRILTKPLYKGVLNQAGYSVDAPHLAIVSAETWDASQQALKQNARTSSRNTGRVYLLGGGLMVCAACSYSYTGMTPAPNKGRAYYLCGGRIDHKRRHCEPCRAPKYPVEAIEAAVWQQLVHAAQHPGEIIQRLSAEAGGLADQAGELQERADNLTSIIKGLAQARERLQRLYVRGHLDEAKYDMEARELDDEEAAATEQLRVVAALLTDRSRIERALGGAEALLVSIRAAIERGPSPENQRYLLRRAIERVIVEPHGDQWRVRVRFVFGEAPHVASQDTDNWGCNMGERLRLDVPLLAA